MQRVFLTGGTGFVGRRLLDCLARSGRQVVALDRSGALNAPGVETVRGDLLTPATYRDALATCDVVVHLAASTGNASAEEHFRVNARGTELLVDAARHAGIKRFLFVSSVAVTFPDLNGYHYAKAKALAEAHVRSSGLRFLIVRPTMILGTGAPILASLEKLATLPVALLPGSGRALVEPVHVDDVASALSKAIETDAFNGEAVALGGPERLSMEALVRRLRAARKGKGGPLVRVPLPALQIPLRIAEAAGLGRFLPVTAGQLSSFRFDGLGAPNSLQEAGRQRGLDDMLVRSETQASSAAADLDAECDLFTRHLINRAAGDYVRSKYRAAHDAVPALLPHGAFDRYLVSFARRGRMFTRLADAHAALFVPASALRKKLVLLLAILETCPPSHRLLDEPVGGRPVRAMMVLSVTGAAALLSLVAGSLILVPIRALLALRGGGRT